MKHIYIKKYDIFKKIITLLMLTVEVASIKAMDPATMALIAQVIPDNLNVGFSFDINLQHINQNCYGKVNNSVYNDSGKVTIAQGTCSNTGGQQVSSLGKAGDLTFIDTTKIHTIKRLGTIGAKPKVIPFVGPKANDTWDTATLFTFIPANPDSGTNPRGVVGPLALYNGRAIEVAVRSQDLTPTLAQKEGYKHTQYPHHVLFEVWARMNPSVTGATNFKQIFNKPLPADAQGKQAFSFATDQFGNVTIAYKIAEDYEAPIIFSHEFNAVKETATIK